MTNLLGKNWMAPFNEARKLLGWNAAGTAMKNYSAAEIATEAGAVIGPASSTDNAVARFDSTTGKVVQNSGVTINDTNAMTIPAGGQLAVGTSPGAAQAVYGRILDASVTVADPLSTAFYANATIKAAARTAQLRGFHSFMEIGGEVNNLNTDSIGVLSDLTSWPDSNPTSTPVAGYFVTRNYGLDAAFGVDLICNGHHYFALDTDVSGITGAEHAVGINGRDHPTDNFAVGNRHTSTFSVRGNLSAEVGFAISAITKANPAVVTTTNGHPLVNGDKIYIAGAAGMTQVNDLEFTVANIGGSSVATITGITQASPGVATATAHGFSDGDRVLIASVGGMTWLNGKRLVAKNPTANTFQLYIDNNTGSPVALDTSFFAAYTSGGTATRYTTFELSGIDSTAYGVYTGSGVAYQVAEAGAAIYVRPNTQGYGRFRNGVVVDDQRANSKKVKMGNAAVLLRTAGPHGIRISNNETGNGNSTAGIGIDSTTPIGIDTSGGTFSTAAIKLANLQTILLSSTTDRKFNYNGATGEVQWLDGATVRFALRMNATPILSISGSQVLGARKTGWAVDTGTAKRTANATYSGTAEAAYTQATIQTLMDAVRDLSQTVKALKDDLHGTAGHGLIGT